LLIAPAPSNGAHDPIVGATAAELVRKRVLDVILTGIWIPVQQGFCRHDHAIRAVSALSGLLFDERFLQRVRLLTRTQSLQRDDVVVSDIP
jgi:hypothetical protein